MVQLNIPTSFPSQANPAATVIGPNVRFTVLASRLIRMEYSESGAFENRASQAFWYRYQPAPAFELSQTPEQIDIETEHLHLRYRVTDAGFSPGTLSIAVKATGTVWHFGDHDYRNLGGTARTLDRADGEIPLEPGLMSRAGWAVVDDSQSLVFGEDGWLELRPKVTTRQYYDLYFFGYGHDYLECLDEYARVAGRVPMIPRYALGNWWSRYWDYRQDELRDLMLEFRERQVPLSVCIIDMDWHITETGNASSGWTGYTWNGDLWPDPAGFISWLHQQGLHTALNLHPAEGIWPHEVQYDEMVRWMGQDPASGEPIRFDLADAQFVEGYFKLVHHPMEAHGVDFWWLDWQQGQRMLYSKQPVAEVMDPLWWLNHLHFYDLGRDGLKRPFIFSRWGGLGNQRYPIGFSGDSEVTWDTLEFQPYFTATAANVGFGWWSHDIGGHTGGVEEPELYARWVQLGLFSPILRLHSTKNLFHDRRPWGNGADAFRVAREAMQLRHMLIPYIYSSAWRTMEKSVPLVTPLYYWYSEREEAYRCRNQFFFGSELMVAPFVSPRHPETNLSRHTVWLPPGDWFDFSSGEHFAGNRSLTVYGTLDDIPVLVRAGGIVPMGPRVGWGGVDNPPELTVLAFPGADGAFTLYEDDGDSQAYLACDYALTHISQTWSGRELSFKVAKVEGNPAHVPAGRTYRLVLRGVRRPDTLRLLLNGVSQPVEGEYDENTESLALPPFPVAPGAELALTIGVADGVLLSKRDRRIETSRAMLWPFKLNSYVKRELYMAIPELARDPQALQHYAGGIDRISEAQLMALRNVLERV